MKKVNKTELSDDMREEYDVSQMKNIVRGKHAAEYKKGSNVVVLAPDVAEAFPNETAVNEALRMLINLAKSTSKKAS